jgi:arabinose-5-phosphate isomerase
MREMSARAWAPRPWSTPGRVLGIFTDGDLRRLIEPGATCAAAAGQVMHASPRTIGRSALAAGRRADGAHRITVLLVTDDAANWWALNTNDLMRQGDLMGAAQTWPPSCCCARRACACCSTSTAC